MFETYCREKLAPLALRIALGFVCVYHGFIKIMEAGGTAWASGLPVGWQLAVAWSEFGAGLAILLGLYCRWAAGVMLLVTAGTWIWWQGWRLFTLPLAVLEPFLVLLLAGAALLFLGAGELSLDGRAGGRGGLRLARKKAREA